MQLIDVSIIIINYNTLALTKDCITSIVNNTHNVNYEIILVDNASTDGSGSILKEWSSIYKNVIYLQSTINLGFGRANNLALQYSSGAYVFLLNSDTIILNNAVKIFFDSMNNLPLKYACIGTLLLESDRLSVGPSYGNFPTINRLVKDKFLRIFKRKSYMKNLKTSWQLDNTPYIVDYVIGADLFIRRSVIDKLGLFDPDFFMYSEETEMQYRYKKNGFISAIIKGPKIIHLTPKLQPGKEQYSSLNRYLFYEGQFTYLKKRYNLCYYLLYRIFFVLTNFHQPIRSKGTILQKIQFFLLIMGVKTINHWR